MSRIFNLKVLAVLVLLATMIAGIGNAADLTMATTDHEVVIGSGTWADDTTTVTYTDIDASGNVNARVDFGAGAQYDEVSLSLDGTNYTDCVETAGPPSQTFDCAIARADIAGNNTFTIVAASNDSTP